MEETNTSRSNLRARTEPIRCPNCGEAIGEESMVNSELGVFKYDPATCSTEFAIVNEYMHTCQPTRKFNPLKKEPWQ